MNFDDIYLKPYISDEDFNRYVMLVFQNYFDSDTGEYTPYAARAVLRYGFARYCLFGVPEEASYTDIMNSQQILSQFHDSAAAGIINEVKEMAKDMAEYEKQQRLQYSSPAIELLETFLQKEIERKEQEIELSKAAEKMNITQSRLNKAQAEALEYQNNVNNYFTPEEQANLIRKMDTTDLDMDKWTNELIDKLSEKLYSTEVHNEKLGEIIDAKNEKIRELKKYKDAHDARNVLADK